ncbi:unnamed protein product [Phyllotreta striolata]|uniref:26S proteasome non-ATPase regulatory subunit 5 n=1 Tax=Phyllotreta striolata TaxID=444603 RepID=A0A9N9TLT7_PHYSR|nr:unnamed protein product [Phyllotreta striolata]
MASREEWCADKLSKLLQDDLRISALNEIKEHLTSMPVSEASRFADCLDLPLVFDCLNDSNVENIDLACEVLTLCMTSLTIGETTNRYVVPLERALIHPYSAVKIMALKEIRRDISEENCLSELCKRKSLLNTIVRCVGDSDLSVAKKALDIVVIVGLSDIGLKTLITDDVANELREVMATNEVSRLRVYECVVLIAKESEANLDLIKSTNILKYLLDELNNNDVLLKMNIVELLTQLGSSRHGYNYLEQNGVINKLFLLIEDANDRLTNQYCEPGILKFFGNIAHWKPLELLSKYPKIFDRLFSNLESGDLTIVAISLDTLGIIGLTNQGKSALHSTGNKMTYALKTIVKLLSSFPTDVKIRALNCLEHLLSVSEQQNNVNLITKRWYSILCEQPMEVILRYAKNPFAELKIAGLGILLGLAHQQWGQEEIKNSPGLIEYLLDRKVENVKECKEIKYDIVQALSMSNIFDKQTVTKLQEYVKEGPFYVDPVTEIAFEGNE